MTVLIDLYPLQSASSASAFNEGANKINRLFADALAAGITPQFLLTINSKYQTICAWQWAKTQYPQSQFYYVDLGNSPPEIQARLLALFLDTHAISALFVHTGLDTQRQMLFSLVAKSTQTHIISSDKVALAIQALANNALASCAQKATPSADQKPILSLVSPYPPQKTGVADYVAQLLSYLAAYYQVILVASDQDKELVQTQFSGEVLSASQFTLRKDLHERVLYQLGNSAQHQYAFDLLGTIPGVAILHDFFLGHSLLHAQEEQKIDNAFLLPLLRSHGLEVLPDLQNQGAAFCASKYPTSLALFSKVLGIGFHTAHATQLAYDWYGVIPNDLLFPVPFPKPSKPVLSTEQSIHLHHELGFLPEDFLVASFGFGNAFKEHELIIQAWLASDLAANPRAHLLFIGQYLNPGYLEELKQLLPTDSAHQIHFVGFTSSQDYEKYLAICDVAIQLRKKSHGETSAAIMDCLASGVMVIANNDGSTKEIPDDVVWKISHPTLLSELITALEHVSHHPGVRDRFVQAAYRFVEQAHHPELTAKAYKQLIELGISNSPLARENRLLSEAYLENLTTKQLVDLTKAIIFNRPTLGKKQILFDISDTANFDRRTGIQRVVRSFLAQCLAHPPAQARIEAIYLDKDGTYRYARRYALSQFGQTASEEIDEPVAVKSGDIYFGLDSNLITVVESAPELEDWRNRGVKIVHLIHDLLPVDHPQWFPDFVPFLFHKWLDVVIYHGDELIATSRTGAQHMQAYLSTLANARSTATPALPKVSWAHLGADIVSSLPSNGLPLEAQSLLSQLQKSPTFLMVGTIEPRKGHEQIVNAFEILWAQGLLINLVIVGKPGWGDLQLLEKLATHPLKNERLFCLEQISDQFLELLYANATALIFASLGEGFGLPIIEAAQHQLSVIARDLPIFREIGGSGISYFKTEDAQEFALYLKNWLACEKNTRPDIAQVQFSTWSQSAQQILALLLDETPTH